MTKVKCGKCIACTYYNGLNGSGYQPCHNPQRPVPPEIPRPPIQILYSEVEPNKKNNWLDSFYWHVFIGIGVGMVLMKILVKLGI
ncbi:hypothetical protein [Acinetobacter bereziniae]|uniref:hypothetical protein n=1 Tax=Acinetobacter bereziniae TaxID=106648 RepID=UPI00300B1936